MYVAGIGFFHKYRFGHDPTSIPLVRQLLKGVRRTRPDTPDSRVPITGNLLPILIRALPAVSSSSYEAMLFETAFTLAFFGFLRISEFTCPNKHTPASRMLTNSNVSIRTFGKLRYLVIILRYTKTSKIGERQTVQLVESHTSRLCPVKVVIRYLSVRPQSGLAFLCHFDSSPLTRYQFQAMFKKVIDFAGLSPRRFTSHSFRIGAATTAAAAGWSA